MLGDDREVGGHLTVRPCPYRRAVEAAPGHVVCDCAGGIPVGTDAAEDPLVTEICGACNLPSEIDPSRRACLFLIPVRIWEGGRLRSGFSCRWFYALKPERLPEKVWKVCLGCPHWFPRPPDEASIPRMMDWIHKIIRLYWEPELAKPIWITRLPAGNAEGAPDSPLRDRLYLRIKRFREALRARRTRRASAVTRAEG